MSDRWPLTGRVEELSVIAEALTAETNRGVVIAGSAGVGKTRLARAATDAAARSGWAVRRIAGTATGRSVTLGAFARWADETSTTPAVLARKVIAELSAGTNGAPLLVYIDDAHLLDELSALIVHQLVLQEVAAVIATTRTGDPASDAVTALWKDGLLPRLELQPLSRRETGHLLTTVLGGDVRADCADRMYRLSRGNVLYLRHLVEHELETGRLSSAEGEWRWQGTPSVSPSLIELVDQQIGAVPEEVRDVVDLVAVAEPVGRQILQELTDAAAIEAAENRGLIQSASAADTIYMGHPLYGEIRLSQCGSLRLRRLRGRVAAAMAQAPVADPLRLGLLWLDSDLPPDPVLLSQAAQIAGSRLDLPLAERIARAAVDAQASPQAKLSLAYILVMRAKGDEVEQILDSIAPEDLAVPGIDGVTLRAANQLFLLGNPEGARSVLADAIGLGDHTRNHLLHAYRAVVEVMTAQPADVLATAALIDYDQLDDFGKILGYAAETIALGDVGRTQEATQRASLGYRVLAEAPLEAFHGTGIAEFDAYGLLAAGRISDAVAVAEREFRRCLDLPGFSQALAYAAVGMTALAAGDLPVALRHFHSAADGFGNGDDVFVPFYRFRILYTEALARHGEVESALASLDLMSRGRHPSYQYVESGFLLARAWVCAVQGRVGDAVEFASQAAQFAREHGQPAREVLSLQAAVQFGDHSVATRLTELAAEVEGTRAPLVARYAHAMAADDCDTLAAISREFETMGDVLAAADAAAHAAVAGRRAGRRGSALSANARARDLARRCGGAVSPALAASDVPLPLTRREHEIAQLVAQGFSNREIADMMSLSVRTVEGHIYQASAKAGVSSRADLLALIRQFHGAGAKAPTTQSGPPVGQA